MNERFELVEEPTGTWAVFDTIVGVPASVEGRVLIGLSKEEAAAWFASMLSETVAHASRCDAAFTSDEELL